MDTFYIVLEVQNDGVPGIISLVYTEEGLAYHQYYTILAAASISALKYHAGFIIRDDGVMIEGKVFDRRPKPEPVPPEPEEEPEET